MVNYYIYAKDYSGSTDGVSYYHTNGMKTIEEFKNDVEKIKKQLLNSGEPEVESKIIYLHWGHKCYDVGEKTTIKDYQEMKGNMGTEPECIVKWLRDSGIGTRENKIQLLYIITDGQIEHESTSKCLQLNKKMHYEMVVFHTFSTNLNNIDLSVASSFFKKRCIVYRNYEIIDNINIGEEYNYDKINSDNFSVEKENLKSYIKLKFLNTAKHDILALNEIDKLKKLRGRLFVELSSKSKKKVDLNTKDKTKFLQDFVETDWYKTLNGSDQKLIVEKSVSTLINYITCEKKSFSFDALRFDKDFQKPVEEETIVDVNFTTEQEIEFPDIILDDDKGIPVIIITELNLLDKIIFHKAKHDDNVSPASFNKFKSAMECPLFLLNDPDISESIGYFYTLNVYKQLLNTNKTEPRTRRPFHGGLVLTSTNDFDKYNDYILSATYFNFKKVAYNVGLFYYVLWKNCENKEWMDRNVVEQFKKYVMRRVSETVCRIGLSSLPLDPDHQTSLLTALWYCVELSSYIFKNDPQNFANERLRMYHGVAHSMIEILKHFEYDLDLETIAKRRDLISHVMILKRISRPVEKAEYMLGKIFKKVNGFLISEIEKPHNFNKLNYLKLKHREILPDSIIDETVKLNEYAHFMHVLGNIDDLEENVDTVDICEKTFRPLFVVDENKSYYTKVVNACKKVILNIKDKNEIKIAYEAVESLEFNRILSLYNLYINCVIKHKKYPTLSEYLEHIAQRKRYIGDLVTIFPPNVYNGAKDVHSRYQNIVANVDIVNFIDVFKKCVNRRDRIKIEETVKLNDDEEIWKFIAIEESKVGLKKTVFKKSEPAPVLRNRNGIIISYKYTF